MSEQEVRMFLRDVKCAFMMHNPFFYFLLNNLEVVYIDRVSEKRDDKGVVIANTPLAVDGIRLIIYKNALGDSFVKKYPMPTIKHELVHIALGHCFRGVEIMRHTALKHNVLMTAENIEKVRFFVNLAMDAKDNYMLSLDKDDVSWGFNGKGFWSETEIAEDSVEELAEKMFDKIPHTSVLGFGAGVDIQKFVGEESINGGTMIQEGNPNFKNAEGRELEALVKAKVIESITKAKMAGVERGGFLREIDELLLSPKQQAWWMRLRYLMRSQIVRSKITDWRVINRKLPNQIAGVKTIKKPKCACFIDVSGSISENEYRLFMAEMLLISKDADVTGVFWDGGIQEIRKIRCNSDIKKAVVGGGGTTFKPVLENFNFNGYDLMVCLTDGVWYDREEAVKLLSKLYNVYRILCTTGSVVEGFNETIKIEEED
jgi:predicted metal-dependent peptidase